MFKLYSLVIQPLSFLNFSLSGHYISTMKNVLIYWIGLLTTSYSMFAYSPATYVNGSVTSLEIHSSASLRLDTATFATGCFWCTEAKFQQLKGVKKVVSGYTGGQLVKPTYKQVSTGKTGHAEACNIAYDPAQITYDELLAAFFTAHDPTQLNRQGNDIGTQYRSAIFYHNAAQKQKATYYISKLNAEKAYKSPIVTQLSPYTAFYKAEDYHQNFYNQNPNQRYCKLVIQPELAKFKKVFHDKLKP